MGLFCADLKATLESAVETAICNLRLWQQEHRPDSEHNYSHTYMLRMAIYDIEKAIKRIEEHPENYKDLRTITKMEQNDGNT